MSNEKESHWALDKRIPIALIITIAIQTAGFAFYMGQLSVRIETAERQISNVTDARERLIRVEEGLKNVLRTLETMNRKLEDK